MELVSRAYFHSDTHAYPTLWSALRARPASPPASLDREATEALLRGSPLRASPADAERTFLCDLFVRCPAPELPARPAETPARALLVLRDALCAAVRDALAAPGPVALALSGGLDAALLLALARDSGLAPPAVYTLSPAFPAYTEVARTRRIAEALGVPLTEVPALERDFVSALPDATRAAAEPFYNLHPCGRVVLARRLATDGARAVLTGDGADQLFAASPSRDWTPLVHDLARAGGVELRAPFLDPRVRDAALHVTRGEGKPALRALARTLLPAWVTDAPKTSALAPPMELAPVLSVASLARNDALFPELARAARDGDDRARVRRATLSLLCDEARVSLL